MQKQILHITTHMGGGVGKVLSGIAAFAQGNRDHYRHKILLLEPPKKTNFIDICNENNVDIGVVTSKEQLISAMCAADIVQLEWWHHPVMAGLLRDFPSVPLRLVIWSHISGCYYPWISSEFVKLPAKFIFTSQYSFDNEYWNPDQADFARHNCAMVNSSGGFPHIQRQRTKHQGFNIGYIGTQSYAKLHADFVQFCVGIAGLPDVEFTMVGDITNQQLILRDARRLKIADKFKFIDYVADVNAEFAKFDVFGYLLNATHFGTTENVLLEAMAAGLPVVCMAQCAEQYLIRNKETGLLVHNKAEYKTAIEFLYDHPAECKRLGDNARKFVLADFAVEKTVDKLHEIYDVVLQSQPRQYNFRAVFGQKPHEIFLSCLPYELRAIFESTLPDQRNDIEAKHMFRQLPSILKEQSKSSIAQFYRTYPADKVLGYWISLV